MAVAVLDGRPSALGSRTRWSVLAAAVLAGLLLITGVALRPTPVADPPLLAEVPPVDRAEQARWLAAGRVPVVAELADSTLVADALRDLHTLTEPYGVPVAGWAEPWRYVWPRDSALAAAALARTGYPAEAERVLDFLQRVQPASGEFQARYLPDGSGGVPDERGTQLDGTGWALWATAEVIAARPAGERTALVQRYRALLDGSTAQALAATDGGRRLPVSADYWETWEWRPTLATAALLHAGLVAATDLYGMVGDEAARQSAAAGAAKLWSSIHERFGPDYPRRLGGRASTIDLGVNFLLPPFAPASDPGVARAWREAERHLTRPAGGLAPGGSWRDDGLSWTTSTSMYALTAAAAGDRAAAVGWLRWLDTHRTDAGALPEKVTATGDPAAVAPLAWTAAVVILAATELERP